MNTTELPVGLPLNTSAIAYLENLTTTPQDEMSAVPTSYYTFIRDIYFVLNGLVVCSGLVFNTIALLVFATSTTLRRTTTGHYLIALAVSDSAYLSADLFRWLGSSGHSWHSYIQAAGVVHHNNILCKLVYTVRYAAMLCSSWITVFITTERFLTIKLPLKIGQISTPKLAKISISIIVLCSCALCIYPFWCLNVAEYKGQNICLMILDKFVFKLYNIMVWISVRVMTFIIPCVIVLFFTVWIIWLLRERDRTQYALQAHTAQTHGAERRSALERQLTIMLVAVAIAFLILRLPYIVIWDINQNKRTFWPNLTNWQSYDIYVAFKLTDILYISNYAVNFFLYFLCGSAFRRQLKKMCCCKGSAGQSTIMKRGFGTATSNISRRSSSTSRSNTNVSHISQYPNDAVHLKNRGLSEHNGHNANDTHMDNNKV